MKTFLVYNTSYFGDTILTDALCRNLKRLYPESRLVFISNKPFADISRYMDGVDEVWTYDKWGIHKGLAGWYKFYKEHKNQYGFDAAFVIYGNERGILLSKFLGAKKIYADNRHAIVRLLLSNGKINYGKWIHVQDRHAYLAELYAGKPMESMKIRYHVPDEAFAYINEQLLKGISKPIIALNPVTKRKEKDLKPDTLLTLAKKIKDAGMIPAMIGAGKDCESFYENLPPAGRQVLLNLVNKTTIPQLGALLKSCAVLISADTGTAHFALALDVPVVDVFYLNDESNLAAWGPKAFYRHRLIARGGDFSAENIWKNTQDLIAENISL